MITEEKFLAYVRVRDSGITNMFDVPYVIQLADRLADVTLTEKDCFDIMEKFGTYMKKFDVKDRQRIQEN